MPDFDSITDELASAGSQRDSSGIDYYGTPTLNARPESIIDAEAVLDVVFTGNVTDEQNLRGASNWQDEGAFVAVLKNPTIVAGDLWAATGRDDDQAPKYKLVNMDDDEVEESFAKGDDGTPTQNGINVGGNTFESEAAEAFTTTAGETLDEETLAKAPVDAEDVVVRLFLGSGKGQRVGQLLDVMGGQSAYYADPDGPEDYDSSVDGLVEYPANYGTDDYEPSGDDNYPRIARTPDLREDVVGEPLRFVFTFGSDGGSEGFKQHNVAIVTIDEVGQSVDMETIGDRALAPLDADSAEDGPTHGSYIVWSDPDDVVSDESVEDATHDGDFTAIPGNGDVDGYDDLATDQQQFVDELVDHPDGPFTSEDFDEWEATVQEAIETDGMTEIDADSLGTILDERAASATEA